MNYVKTFLLMGVLTCILVALGSAIGGSQGALIFLTIAVVMNFYSYYNSDKLVIRMTGSKPAMERDYPQLYATLRELTRRAELPMPMVYITPSPQCNAFATGRNEKHAAVAVTQGLLNTLSSAELEGVLAHELAHIKNKDILIGTIAACMAGAISMIGHMLQWGAIFGMGGRDNDNGGAVGALAMAILAPIAALLVQMSISRSREYLADETGAKLTRNPNGLANALVRLEQSARQIPMQVQPAASHMFIVKPFSGGGVAELFSTHPPIAKRVERLRSMVL